MPSITFIAHICPLPLRVGAKLIQRSYAATRQQKLRFGLFIMVTAVEHMDSMV
jgi:hypothetical protein